MRLRIFGHRLHRLCPSLSRILQSRTAAVTAILGVASVMYYMHYYQGMHLHMDLPGLSLNNAEEGGLDAPMPMPKFEHFLSEKRHGKLASANRQIKNKLVGARSGSKGNRNKQPDLPPLTQKAPEKPAITRMPITSQQIRRRRGDVDYLPNINLTILHSPNLTDACATSRLRFVIGSSVLGDLPNNLAASATAVSLAEAARRQRQAVRDTWATSLRSANLAQEWRGGCAIFYALARDTAAQQLLIEESKQTQDILIFTASANTLADWSPRELDTISSAKALFHLAPERRNPLGYTIRTNDKAFWNIKKLVGFLHSLDSIGTDNSSKTVLHLAGKSLRSDWVHRDPLDPNYTSRRQFPDQMYPESALDNPGYAISNSALKAMHSLTNSTPLVYYRETYITGILRQSAQVELEPMADIKISKAVPVSPCHYRLYIATPTVEAQEMLSVWPQFNNPNHKCSYSMIEDNGEDGPL